MLPFFCWSPKVNVATIGTSMAVKKSDYSYAVAGRGSVILRFGSANVSSVCTLVPRKKKGS